MTSEEAYEEKIEELQSELEKKCIDNNHLRALNSRWMRLMNYFLLELEAEGVTITKVLDVTEKREVNRIRGILLPRKLTQLIKYSILARFDLQ